MPSGNYLVDKEQSEIEYCSFCDGEGTISSWKTYIHAWREAKTRKYNSWMDLISWRQVLKDCRDIRDGWVGRYTNRMNYFQDCPCCK